MKIRKKNGSIIPKSPNLIIKLVMTISTVAIIYLNTSLNLISINTYTNEISFE